MILSKSSLKTFFQGRLLTTFFLLVVLALFFLLRSDYGFLDAVKRVFSPLDEGVLQVQFEKGYHLDYQNLRSDSFSTVVSDNPQLWKDWTTMKVAAQHTLSVDSSLMSESGSLVSKYFSLPQELHDFSFLTFYLYPQDAVGSFQVFLKEDEENFFVADLSQPFEQGRWNFVTIHWWEFKPVGDPDLTRLKELQFEFQSPIDESSTVFLDEVRYVVNDDYGHDWLTLNNSLLQFLRLPDESVALALQNFNQRVFYPKKIKAFLNGSLSARVDLLEKGKRCGIALRGQEDAGFWFVVARSQKPMWYLYGGGNDKVLLGKGSLDFPLDDSVWLKAVAVDKNIALFAGPSEDDVRLVTWTTDRDLKVRRAGLVVLDRMRCLYRDITLHFDPHDL